MGTTYYRRFRMEIEFAAVRLPKPLLPDGYVWTPWHASLLDRHAAVKYDSFRSGIDARVFACLGDLAGCRRLMGEITRQRNFVPRATWLITRAPVVSDRPLDCGTIQGMTANPALGAIQNVGVVPEHRGQGLGRALVLKSLHGFRRGGVKRVYLEVTADNTTAVELYRSLGFRLLRTMYKAVEDAEAAYSISR